MQGSADISSGLLGQRKPQTAAILKLSSQPVFFFLMLDFLFKFLLLPLFFNKALAQFLIIHEVQFLQVPLFIHFSLLFLGLI